MKSMLARSWMRSSSVLSVSLSALFAASVQAQNLLGTWEAMVDNERVVMEFRADQTVLLRGESGEPTQGHYLCDTYGTPIRLDLIGLQGGAYDDDARTIGIAEFLGPDTMRYCAARVLLDEPDPESKRPATFGADTLVFKRVKAAAAPPAPARAPPVVPQAPPAAAPVPAAAVPATASWPGTWALEFTFIRNTFNPAEQMRPWANLMCAFSQDGDNVRGSLGSGGTISAKAAGPGLVGTLRFGHDNHDWQVFALRLTDGPDAGEGIAIYAPRPGQDDERHIYRVKARRQP